MMHARQILAMLILMVNVAVPRAATFYCDPAKGSPQGDGSAQRPLRTIEEVIGARLIELRNADGKCANPGAPVRAGDTILLRSGWHGVIRIPRGFNYEFITIAADKGQSPQVGWIEIGEGRKWRIKGLTVSPSLMPNEGTTETKGTEAAKSAPARSAAPTGASRLPHSLVTLGERGGEESAELVVEDCFIYSVLDTTAWTGVDWVNKPQSGIWLGRHGKGHVARNNFVLNTRFGIALCAPDCLCEGNVVANFSADGIRATRDGQIVQYNVIKNNFVGARDGDRNHDDGIQVFLFNVGTGTVRNIVLRGNIILARETDGLPWPNPLQGIGCFDGPLINFTVEKNVVCTNHYHGISLYDAQGCTIQDNTCFSRWGGRMRPWVMLGQKRRTGWQPVQMRGNTVRNNLAHTFNLKADPAPAAENNREVTEADFKSNLSDLSAFIAAKFGLIHPAANRPRLEQRALERGAAIGFAAPAASSQPTNGPLRVHPTNPRYFTDGSGKAVFLTGSHTWGNLQDYRYAALPSPPPMDFGAYLAFLKRHNHNFFRLWAWESCWNPHAKQGTIYYDPMPYERPGPGAALDGKPKFDLTRFNPAYFDRLRSRVKAARDNGIYVSVMLFNGFSIEGKGNVGGDPWQGHPFNPRNNVNGIDGGGSGAVHTLSNPTVTAHQESYVRKVIDTVADLDNVLYEITNEDSGTTAGIAWQTHIIRFIKRDEATKPKQHPVGMTVAYPGGNDAVLRQSPADWISPAAKLPTADGRKVIVNDTDHCYFWIGLKKDGLAAQRAWVWENFTRGNQCLFMDPYLDPSHDPGRNNPVGAQTDPYWNTIRDAMGRTRAWAARMNLVATAPHGELASTGFCLANPGKEYLIYLPQGGEVTVDLSAAVGALAVEWMDPVKGTVTRAEPTTGGGQRIMKAPFTGDAVLYLRRKEF